MINDKLLNLYPDMQSYCPEFRDFLQMCYGIKLKVTIAKKIDEKVGVEDLLTLRTIEIGEKDPITHDISNKVRITASWLDNIDYEGLEECTNDCVNPVYPSDATPSDIAMFQSNDAATLRDLNELRKMEVPQGFQGQVVTEDMAITLSGDLVQAAITLEDQGVVIAYGALKGKMLDSVHVAFYDSIFALDENVDQPDVAYEPLININNIKQTVEKLTAKGEMPIREEELNFKEFLSSQNLFSMVPAPIAALYYTKDALVARMKPREKA